MANYGNAIDARATFITLMLCEDHQKLKELFDQFGKAKNKTEERNIVTSAIASRWREVECPVYGPERTRQAPYQRGGGEDVAPSGEGRLGL